MLGKQNVVSDAPLRMPSVKVQQRIRKCHVFVYGLGFFRELGETIRTNILSFYVVSRLIAKTKTKYNVPY
jgi:hypothetical protein